MGRRVSVRNRTCVFRHTDAAIEARNEFVGGIAQFADVQVVEFLIRLGSGGNRRPSQHADFAGMAGTAGDGVNFRGLNVHPGHEHRVRQA